jgi:hypothetical protein
VAADRNIADIVENMMSWLRGNNSTGNIIQNVINQHGIEGPLGR